MATNSNNSVISGAANAAKSISGGKLVIGSQEAKKTYDPNKGNA